MHLLRAGKNDTRSDVLRETTRVARPIRESNVSRLSLGTASLNQSAATGNSSTTLLRNNSQSFSLMNIGLLDTYRSI